MNRLLIMATLLLNSALSATALEGMSGSEGQAFPGSFAMSSKDWQGTHLYTVEQGAITTLYGVVTDADMREYCDRDAGGETTEYGGKLTKEQCVSKNMKDVIGKIYTAKVNCKNNSVSTSWGTAYQFRKQRGEIIWRDMKTKEVPPSSWTYASEKLHALACPTSPFEKAPLQTESEYIKKYPYFGRWVANKDDCQEEFVETFMDFEGISATGYENSCIIQIADGKEPNYVLKGYCAAEGDVRRKNITLSMKSKSEAVIDGVKMFRCEAKKSAKRN